MFKKNRRHLQIPLTSHVDELPEKLRKRLGTSWAGVFYREFFCRLKEEPFAVLYADCPSRPNVPNRSRCRSPHRPRRPPRPETRFLGLFTGQPVADPCQVGPMIGDVPRGLADDVGVSDADDLDQSLYLDLTIT